MIAELFFQVLIPVVLSFVAAVICCEIVLLSMDRQERRERNQRRRETVRVTRRKED